MLPGHKPSSILGLHAHKVQKPLFSAYWQASASWPIKTLLCSVWGERGLKSQELKRFSFRQKLKGPLYEKKKKQFLEVKIIQSNFCKVQE